jgi:biopolymer transport protein ExbB
VRNSVSRKAPVLLLLLLVLPSLAQAWWNDEWSFRKAITVDTSAPEAGVAEGVTDAPVLLRLHTGNFGYFFDVKEGGGDLRLLAGDDTTPLKYHVESWDPINELGFVWVRLPQLPAGGQETLYMYYGNTLAEPAAEPAATFDDDTVLRLHFADQGSPRDATAYGNHPSALSGESVEASFIGPGYRLEQGQRVVVPASPSLAVDSAAGLTVSLWLKPQAVAGPSAAAEGETSEESAAGEPAWSGAPVVTATDGAARLALVQTGSGLVGRLVTADGAVVETAPAPVTVGAWQHAALVLRDGSLAVYLDGAEATATAVPAVSFPARLVLGTPEGTTQGYAGELDEVAVATAARSPSWLALAAANQGPNDPLLSYGVDESREDAGGMHLGNFAIIFQAVFGNPEAIVEQGVIVVCAIMAAISLLVMFFKGLFLSRAQRATRRFLQAFRQLTVDPDDEERGLKGLYEAHRKFGDSPLFRVYRLGFDEVGSRVGPAVGAQSAGLDAKALTSVRAAMDAAMVRERQRMDSRMVLLTIAISGGPFIGLLGTVVGVMVTFAAIAQAGDVNITAIAPGMAAALLATVSGLAVAIPALFGYNYLGSRIKELTADMHVFADELGAKITEAYGR